MPTKTKKPRTHNRSATNSAGLASFDGKETPVILRDVSSVGAKLRPVSKVTLPDAFRLVIPLEKIDVGCKVIWRRGSDCGVKFE